jgi:murein DD-endopeptidase MepM/ murein hydrolase activator NlpD
MRHLRRVWVLFVVLFIVNQGQWTSSQSSYAVQAGDTLTSIARRFGVSVSELQQSNALATSQLYIGQRLRVPSTVLASTNATNASTNTGISNHRVQSGETLESILQRYGIDRAILDHLNPNIRGQSGFAPNTTLRVPSQPGALLRMPADQDLLTFAVSHGVSLSQLLRINGLSSPTQVTTGTRLFVPGARVSTATATDASNSTPSGTSNLSTASTTTNTTNIQAALPRTSSPEPTSLADNRSQLVNQHLQLLAAAVPTLRTYRERAPTPAQRFLWPTAARGVISSPFGPRRLAITRSTFHAGMDIAVPTGTAILATKDGVVSRAGWIGSYGYAVYLEHSDGSQTRYAHMSRVLVRSGQRVRQGERIGLVGSTGLSTGPHLHFEIRYAGRAVNPALYLR